MKIKYDPLILHTIADIMHFIFHNYPTISLYSFQFNEKQLLDTVNPSHYYQFRSFLFPVSMQLEYMENKYDEYIQSSETISTFDGLETIKYSNTTPDKYDL